ncbi:MAG TPA: TldD/PmbA family protein [Chloroflexia bacterium]|nr:TldD/PmbA family protein [Chloroflexia bacterium]
MPKELRVEKYSDALDALLQKARDLDVYVIGRVQDSKGRSMTVNNGRLERIDTGSAVGIGVQVFTREGHTGFVSSDQVTPESCRELVETAARLARSASAFGTEANRAVFEVSSNGKQVVATDFKTLDETSYDEQVKMLLEMNERACGYGEGLSVRTSHGVSDPHWRIVRSDGTDISFDTPHASAGMGITAAAANGGKASTVNASVSGADAAVLLDSSYQEKLELRSKKSAGLAQQLITAPQIKGGNYKLVIDYALAKGLAHEAFGHASETDGMETSILGNNGKMRVGENMAASIVTITDGPVLGDYAYQPISANGMPRQTVEILKLGVLQAGLGDLFSAGKAGVPISGAERIESYRNLPLPRMSNIRITVSNPVPFDMRFELVTPQELRQKLIESGLLQDGEPALYLAGYKGGQVNPKEGDFVFNCAAIYDLSQPELPLYQPAIFSGKVLAALHSILGGLGPVHLDAMGHCGKGGQSVPSSGGSHSFIVIDRNENVFIGGAS